MFKRLALTAALLIAALPAAAAQFDFYKLGRGAASDFLPSDGIACTSGDLCSSNVNGGTFNGDLTFSNGGVTVRATGTWNGNTAAAVQDHQSNWTTANSAGLGVYHSSISSDDNITVGEVLTLSFDQLVNLSAIGLRAEGHNFTGWSTGATFLLNGVSTLLPDNVGTISGLNMTGSVFTFGYGGNRPEQFYLASATVTPIPEPEIVALMMAGLGMTGFMARRRKARRA